MKYGAAVVAFLFLASSGCVALKGLFTEPTGQMTFERQEFIDAYGMAYVFVEDWFKDADEACAAKRWAAARCAKLPEAKRKAQAIDVRVRAKIAVPESRLDWGEIKDLLGLLVSLRP